jgi:hypothetical protein
MYRRRYEAHDGMDRPPFASCTGNPTEKRNRRLNNVPYTVPGTAEESFIAGSIEYAVLSNNVVYFEVGN